MTFDFSFKAHRKHIPCAPAKTKVFRVLDGLYLFEVKDERFKANAGDMESVEILRSS
jgi:hypothetical protein